MLIVKFDRDGNQNPGENNAPVNESHRADISGKPFSRLDYDNAPVRLALDNTADYTVRAGLSDWLPDWFNRPYKIEKTPYAGPRDGSSKAVIGVAKERLNDEIYRNSYMSITKRGDLACAIAASTVYRDAGVKGPGGGPLPLRLATRDMRNDLLNAGWKVVDKASEELKPGYFVEAFGALDGSGAHHAIIIGEPARRGQKHPVSGAAYNAGEIMAWNNNRRTRKDDSPKENLKWWNVESLAEATAEYRNYFVLRPPLPGEKLTVASEKEKVGRILVGRN